MVLRMKHFEHLNLGSMSIKNINRIMQSMLLIKCDVGHCS